MRGDPSRPALPAAHALLVTHSHAFIHTRRRTQAKATADRCARQLLQKEAVPDPETRRPQIRAAIEKVVEKHLTTVGLVGGKAPHDGGLRVVESYGWWRSTGQGGLRVVEQHLTKVGYGWWSSTSRSWVRVVEKHLTTVDSGCTCAVMVGMCGCGTQVMRQYPLLLP